PAQEVRVHAFRQRAPLFGHNAPDPQLLSETGTKLMNLAVDVGSARVWRSFWMWTEIDLDASYPKVTPGGWVLLVSNQNVDPGDPLPGWSMLYRATAVAHPSRSDFGIGGKVTRITPDTTWWVPMFDLRTTLAFAQSEELAVAPRPLFHPVYGAELALARRAEGLRPGQAVAVSGKRQRLQVREGAAGLSLALDGGGSAALGPGDTLWMAGTPVRVAGAALHPVTPAQLAGHLAADAPVTLRLRLRDRDGREGMLTAPSTRLRLAPARKEDETVAEVAWVDDAPGAVAHSRDRTTLRLEAGLRHCYDRGSLRVNANVAPATHGETVSEVLGGGDASARDQRFTLRQAPLTYVSAATPDGRASTLEVRVNDLRWAEAPTLFARGPAERVYTAAADEEGRAVVRFGDGVEGARLPTGQDNVRARYRKGSGAGGNLPAGRLTTLLTRPLGVEGATNPEPAAGGADAEALDDARANAPLQVLTLGRAVSVRDYEDFARAFAGIARAHAVWIPHGPARGVFVTVAGPGGAVIPVPGATHGALVDALRRFGDALLPLRVASYAPTPFRVRAQVKVADDAEPAKVLEAARALLRERFGFAARAFGQTVSVDEVAAVLHQAAGVRAVNVDRLYRGATPALQPRLFAAVPFASPGGSPHPAELLTLDEASLELGVMP
ncbi:MAG TPA: putative baseplate assembly protein, partial [Longimicrobium sp.]|nr:putative baseplate assembly protein [Longimicrobium sp.]